MQGHFWLPVTVNSGVGVDIDVGFSIATGAEPEQGDTHNLFKLFTL